MEEEEASYPHLLFSEYLEDKHLLDKLSFQHCLEELDMYLNQNNLHCADHMRSIPELFSPEHHRETNYDQSHVNEITTQHLTQLKRKFEPMETIPEDEKHRSSLNSDPHFSKHQFAHHHPLHQPQ